MTHSAALTHITVAGYHGDNREAVRIYTASRISLAAYSTAILQGKSMRKNGIACTCMKCKP